MELSETKAHKSQKSVEERLSERKSKYHELIRKTEKNKLLSERRHNLIENLREKIIKHVMEEFKNLTANETLDILEQLSQEATSEHFNEKLLKMELDRSLARMLTLSSTPIQAKIAIVGVLKVLATYSESQNFSIVNPALIAVLVKEIQTHNFNDHFLYITEMLHVISSVSSLKQNTDLYRQLTTEAPRPNLKTPSNFCQWLRAKLVRQIDPVVFQQNRVEPLEYVVRIRRSLILNNFQWPFVKETLEQLEIIYTEYEFMDMFYYCKIMITIIENCPQKHQNALKDMFNSHLVFCLEGVFDRYEQIDQDMDLIILRLIATLYDFEITFAAGLLSLVQMDYFIELLKCPQMKEEVIQTIALLGTTFLEVYPETQQHTRQLIHILMETLESGAYTQDVLKCLNLFALGTWSNSTEELLKQQIISKVVELLEKQHSSNQIYVTLLEIIHNLMDFGGERIIKLLSSRGVPEIIQNRQDLGGWRIDHLTNEILNDFNAVKQ